MASFPELLRFRQGLLSDAYKLPGLLQNLQQPQGPPQAPPGPQMPPQQPQGQGGGFQNALGQVFGGANDPRLTGDQNEAAKRQALLQAGLAILASPESGIRAIAQGGLFGQRAGEQIREQTYGRTQQERIALALRDPSLTARMSPDQQALIRLLPPEQAAEMLSKILFAPAGETKIGKPGDWIIGADGTPQMQLGGTTPDAMSDSALKTALVENNLTEQSFQSAPDPVKAAVVQRANEIRHVTSPKEPLGARGNEKLQDIYLDQYKTVYAAAHGAQQTIANYDVMEQLLNDDPKLTGGLQDLYQPLRSILAGAGIGDVSKLSNQEIFNKYTNETLFSKVKALQGGRILASELALMNQTIPNLHNTVAANKLLIKLGKRTEEAKIRESAMMGDWLRTHDNDLSGFEQEMDAYYKEHPLLEGINLKAEVNAANNQSEIGDGSKAKPIPYNG